MKVEIPDTISIPKGYKEKKNGRVVASDMVLENNKWISLANVMLETNALLTVLDASEFKVPVIRKLAKNE